MKSNKLIIILVALASGAIAEHRVDLFFEEVQNIVTQQLAIAQSKDDTKALQTAYNAITGRGYTNTTVHARYTPEEFIFLCLHVLMIADRMQDKSYDCAAKLKAGIYDNVPWPPDSERPEELRKMPLWMPRTRPEYFKERDPELYAFYKPLYEENQRNTAKYLREARIRVVREKVLLDIKGGLGAECARGTNSLYFACYLHLINETITDKSLRDEILSDISAERRMPETSTKNGNQ